MNTLKIAELNDWYPQNFESNLSGLRILFSDIEPLIEKLKFEKVILGYSENKLPIYKIKIGTGKKRILIWSQMHGNESTGTKAVFDLFRFFSSSADFSGVRQEILEQCTISFIPMLNPDGAILYTRENSRSIDLNRDAVALKAVESRLLRNELDSFRPSFCFNLHDQRTIFNVSGFKNPATLSFLAPSEEESRALTTGRKETMSIIAVMNSWLQELIPNHVGRYTDEFYPTATGDNFQKLGYNTILVEAGHFPGDYHREVTRKFNFMALLKGIHYLACSDDYSNYKPYFNIPNNDKKFFDIIYRNTKLDNDTSNELTDLGVLYRYTVIDNNLVRNEHIEKIGNLHSFYAHCEIDLNGKTYNQ